MKVTLEVGVYAFVCVYILDIMYINLFKVIIGLEGCDDGWQL